MDRFFASILLVGALTATPSMAQQAPANAEEARPAAPRPIAPRAFRSPEEGFTALIAALRASDDQALLRILGSAGQRLVRSGDRVIDRAARATVLDGYALKNEILRPAPNEAILQLGPDDWQVPLPMVERGGAWRFDAAAATQEIVDRRIGRNELDTIGTLRAMAGALRAYARPFFSTPGQRDGLYWPTVEGEAASPLGPLAATASAGGYGRRQRGDRPEPYNGYI